MFGQIINLNTGAGGAKEPPSILTPLLRTIGHFFPDFGNWLRSVRDHRDRRRITYPMAFELWTALFLFWSKLTARRQITLQFNTPVCLRTLNFLAQCNMKRMMAPDTLPYGIWRIPEEDLRSIQHGMLYQLLRKKSLSFARLLGRYYTISFDMTGYQSFNYRHCDSCLMREITGQKVYLHEVLEAKLISSTGLALSVASEFVEKPDNEHSRQDCELKAFYRLAPQLKKLFPQLQVCLLLDGLYAVGPVLDICKQFGWQYIITFKEGRAPATFDEYERLWAIEGKSACKEGREFRWLNGLNYGSHNINVLECREELKRFVWMTNLHITQENLHKIADKGGRQRWRIENEGFNMQKNGGYGLEHAYCENEELLKKFYLLLQIAHTIYQLIEHGLLKKSITKTIGSIRNVARWLTEEIRLKGLDIKQFEALANKRIQIRLDTS